MHCLAVVLWFSNAINAIRRGCEVVWCIQIDQYQVTNFSLLFEHRNGSRAANGMLGFVLQELVKFIIPSPHIGFIGIAYASAQCIGVNRTFRLLAHQ